MQNRWAVRLIITLVTIVAVLNTPSRSQERKFLTPPNQVVAIRAAKLFDAKSGNLLNNQIVLIRGERIADVGANIQIPREARVIDLGNATALPGMIDAHVHRVIIAEEDGRPVGIVSTTDILAAVARAEPV